MRVTIGYRVKQNGWQVSSQTFFLVQFFNAQRGVSAKFRKNLQKKERGKKAIFGVLECAKTGRQNVPGTERTDE